MSIIRLITIAGLLISIISGYFVFQRNKGNFEAHQKLVHADKTEISINANLTKINIQNSQGKTFEVITDKSKLSAFQKQTLEHIERYRERIKAKLERDLDNVFKTAFIDKEKAVKDYADWFFAWGQSWSILLNAMSGATKTAMSLQLDQEKIIKSAEHAVQDHLITHYTKYVLKPEERDKIIIKGVQTALQDAHKDYVYMVSGLDHKFQEFIRKNAVSMKPIEADKVINLKLDWNAQKWNSPRFLAKGREYESLQSVALIAGSTVFVGPLLEATILPFMGQIVGEIMTTVGFSLGGGTAGSSILPGLGTIAGLAAGVGADWVLNKFREGMSREDFEKQNLQAVNATIKTWKSKISTSLKTSADQWFDESKRAIAK